MNRPIHELAEVIRRIGNAFEEQYERCISPAQRRALRDIVSCRTAALGGHVEACEACGETRIAYNSCRNRHCPKCQAAARAEWLARQAADLLPVDYFHLVFTLPNDVGSVALQNPHRIYGALFQAAAESLLELAADPKHLGAEMGFLAVLHTWGQSLTLHPHVHCVVPGGGLSQDSQRWVSCRPGFLLAVRPLSRLFRGKFLARLQQLHRRQELVLAGSLVGLADPTRFGRWVETLRGSEWVVYAKPPFGGPEQVLKYLAQYTHRVAISNHRLTAIDDHTVTFRWKDYAQGNTEKLMTLEGVEFLRRFLQHVMPSGFVRIRHFGFLANRFREEKLNRCRVLLAKDPPETQPDPIADPFRDHANRAESEPKLELGRICSACGHGMIVLEVLSKPISTSRPLSDTINCGQGQKLSNEVGDTS